MNFQNRIDPESGHPLKELKHRKYLKNYIHLENNNFIRY